MPERNTPSFVTGRFSPTAAFRYREFRLLFIGLILSSLGNWMQQFALGWLIVELAVRGGTPGLAAFYLGLVGLARAVPAFVFGLMGGVYADRMDRRRLLVLTRLSSGLIAIVLAVLTLTGAINVPLVMLLSGLATATFGFDAPARLAMMPSVLGPHVFSGMGITRAVLQSSILIGPLIGGLLIVHVGVGGVLVATGVMYAASLAMVLLMSSHPVSAQARAMSLRDSIFEASRHIRQEPLVRSLLVFGVIFAVFAQSYIQLLPAVAQDTLHVGAVELSWMVGIGGGGALLGALISASVGGIRRIGWFLIGATLVEGLLIVLLGLQRDLGVTLFILLLIGTGTVTYTGTQSTVVQMTLPDAMRGRVMGVLVALLQAGPSLGALVIGTLGALIGISNALLCSGLIVVASGTAIALRVRAIRDAELATAASVRIAAAIADPAAARLIEDEPST